MAANKRTPKEIEMNRSDLARMMRRGMTTSQICLEFPNISRSQVELDMRVVVDEHLAERYDDLKRWLAQKMMEYAEIKREAWERWDQSKQPAFNDDGSEKKVRPDMDALRIVLECVKDECKLLGLNAPKQDMNKIMENPQKYLEEVLPFVKEALEKIRGSQLPPPIAAPSLPIPMALPIAEMVVDDGTIPTAQEFDMDEYMRNINRELPK